MNFNPVLIAAVLVVVIVAVFLLIGSPGPNDDFAKCVSASGAQMYGAWWCPHCKDQKDMFGSSFKYINYVECSTPDGNSQTPVCISANISTYPTWQLKNGTRFTGVQTFDQLSSYTGCAINSS